LRFANPRREEAYDGIDLVVPGLQNANGQRRRAPKFEEAYAFSTLIAGTAVTRMPMIPAQERQRRAHCPDCA
jgi:hypothetical protein